RGVRLSRAERRRQDDLAEAAAWPCAADFGQWPRARRAAWPSRIAIPDRLLARALSFSRLPERARAAAFPRPAARLAETRARRAHRGIAAARRPRRCGSSAAAHLQQRHGAACWVGPGHAGLARGRVSRRADLGARSAR